MGCWSSGCFAACQILDALSDSAELDVAGPPERGAPGSVKNRSKFGPGGSPGSNYYHPLLTAIHRGGQKCIEMLPFAVEMATFVKRREEYDLYRGRCLRGVRGGPRQSVKPEGNALQI